MTLGYLIPPEKFNPVPTQLMKLVDHHLLKSCFMVIWTRGVIGDPTIADAFKNPPTG